MTEDGDEVSSIDRKDNQCNYIVPKKNRRCKMLTKTGKKFCGEHAIFDPADDSRVVCPLDPRHTVAKEELESHLDVKCNSRFVQKEHLNANMNAVEGETGYMDKIDYRPNQGELSIITDILLNYENELNSAIQSTSTFNHVLPPIQRYLDENPQLSGEKRKHLTQMNNIIVNMLSSPCALLQDEETLCICDLGAGKAQLTYWTAQCAPKVRYLNVDRMGMRNKWDNKAVKERPELCFKRIRCSIEHLDLKKTPQLDGISRVVGICKHLCGSGTDAGVRCMMRLNENGVTSLGGLVLAPCCAHKTRYTEFLGIPFLSSLGVNSPGLFAALRHVASWGTCGLEEREEDGKWSSVWKTRMGRLAKAAIELARAKWIEKESGFEVKIIRYVDESVSPENLLIVARPK